MDLLLDSGDLSILQTEQDNVDTFYDLAIETTDQFLMKILRRTLETPLGHIKLYDYLNNTDITLIDDNYGNAIYNYLSEPLTSTFLAEIRQVLINSLLLIQDIPGFTFLTLTIDNFTFDTIDITINYSIDNTQQTSTTFSFDLT